MIAKQFDRKKFLTEFVKSYSSYLAKSGRIQGDSMKIISTATGSAKMTADLVQEILFIPDSEDVLVHSDMEVVRCSSSGKEIKWSADCHGELITKVKIASRIVSVEEFDKKKYNLDLETGKLLSNS